jgi:hypothetical protein
MLPNRSPKRGGSQSPYEGKAASASAIERPRYRLRICSKAIVASS